MLHLPGQALRFCDGLNRRSFMQIGALGAGLTLADALRLQANSKVATKSKTRPKSAIFIFLSGGPSHLDTYDPKPDAPVEYRGEFKAIPTNVPGVQLSEHMPLQAKMFDKLSVVRSLTSVDEHSDSLTQTGYPERVNMTEHHPSFGAVMSKSREHMASSVPQFVSLRGTSKGIDPGFLGAAHAAFTPNGVGNANLKLVNGVDADRVSDRRSLLSAFDDARREHDATGMMAGMDAYTEKAFDMVMSGETRTALDLKREDAKTQERYKGLEQFLMARRLVEAGVGFVTFSFGGWDTHGNNFTTLKKQVPQLDRGIANLVQDLHDRGMQDDVVTVVWGDFGRTPKINSSAGRDHWSPAMSALVAGGGLKMGQAIGATTAKGERPKDRPYTVPQLMSTLYRAVGIDPGQTFLNGSGRPVYILDDRSPVTELV